MIATSFPGFADADGAAWARRSSASLSAASSSPSTARRRRARARSRRGSARRFGLPVLDTGLLYRAVGVTCWREGGDLGRRGGRGGGRAAARSADGWTTRPSAPAAPARRPAGWRSIRASARRCCDFQRAFAAPAGRRGARRARHRHGDRPGRAGQALRHRLAGGPRAAPLAAAARRRARPSTYDDVLADIAPPRRPRRRPRRLRRCGRADDAVLLDTTEMTIDAAADAARRIVEAARARWEQSRQANPTAPHPRPPREPHSDADRGVHRAQTSTEPTSGRRARPRHCAPPRPSRPDERAQRPMADDMSMNPTRDDFAALLDESLGGGDFVEGHGGPGQGRRRSRRTSRSSTSA